jgi:hypothetical protein
MKTKFISAAVAASLLLTSCLKDRGFDNDKYGIKDPSDPKNSPANVSIVEAGDGGVKISSLQLLPTVETFDLITVSYNADQPAPKDIDVQLVLVPAIVTAYNTANMTNYLPLPASNYTFPSTLNVKIPQGQRKVVVKMTLNKAGLSLSDAYGLGVRINSVSDGITIAENLKENVYAFLLRNKYDGYYTLNGYHNRPPSTSGGADYTFPYKNIDMYLRTSGPNSVHYYFVDAGSTGRPIGISPTTVGWYGSAISPDITMDPATNAVLSCVNIGGATPMSLSLALNPNPRFTWDVAADKPIKLFCATRYNNNDLRSFIDTFTYVGPRP